LSSIFERRHWFHPFFYALFKHKFTWKRPGAQVILRNRVSKKNTLRTFRVRLCVGKKSLDVKCRETTGEDEAEKKSL